MTLAEQDPLPPAAAEIASATTHYVSPGANCGGQAPCYTTPQAAVDVAADGDTIKVATGTYTTTALSGDPGVFQIAGTVGRLFPSQLGCARPACQQNDFGPAERARRARHRCRRLTIGAITTTIKGFTVVNGVNSPPQSCGGICAIFSHVDISNNYLYSNTSASIQVAGTTGTIFNNLVQDTRTDSFTQSNVGIAVESSVITVISNTVKRNGTGIRSFSQGGLGVISYLYNNVVEDNLVGIATEHGDVLEAKYNLVRRNARGIRARDHLVPFTYPTLLTITDNLIDSNSNAGIEMNFVMLGNIANNTITKNKIGISHNAGVGSAISFTANLVDQNFSGGIHITRLCPQHRLQYSQQHRQQQRHTGHLGQRRRQNHLRHQRQLD